MAEIRVYLTVNGVLLDRMLVVPIDATWTWLAQQIRDIAGVSENDQFLQILDTNDRSVLDRSHLVRLIQTHPVQNLQRFGLRSQMTIHGTTGDFRFHVPPPLNIQDEFVNQLTPHVRTFFIYLRDNRLRTAMRRQLEYQRLINGDQIYDYERQRYGLGQYSTGGNCSIFERPELLSEDFRGMQRIPLGDRIFIRRYIAGEQQPPPENRLYFYNSDREHIADILVMHGEDPGDVERLRNLSPAQIDGLRVNNVEPDQ